MNNSEIESVLNKDHKFYWFINSIKDTLQNNTIIDLTKSLLPIIKDDINKPYIKIENTYDNRYSRTDKLKITTPAIELFNLKFSDKFSWGSGVAEEFFNFLKENGMDFTQTAKYYPLDEKEFESVRNGSPEDFVNFFDKLKASEKVVEPFLTYSEGWLDQDKYLYFINAVSSQLPYESFLERVAKAETLQYAVHNSSVKIVNDLIENLNIPVNLEDSNKKTPVMFCRSESMLDIFLEKNLKETNWLATDRVGNDCLYYFGLLSNKEISKTLVKKAQTVVASLVENDADAKSTIDQSNKRALLGMVNSGKNKKEIDDFIRQAKIKDFTGIVDDKGRSMAQIALTKDEWGKFESLKKGYPSSHRDLRGYGNLEFILIKTSPKFQNKAKTVLADELENVASDTGINMVRRFFRLNKPFYAPKWFVNSGYNVDFLRAFYGKELDSDIIKDYEQLIRTNTIMTSLYTVDSNVVSVLKDFVRPYFHHAVKNGHSDDLLNMDLRKALTISTEGSLNAGKYFKISMESFANLYALRELCIEYNLDVSVLDKKVESASIDFIKQAKESLFYNPSPDSAYNIDTFLRSSKPMVNYLMDSDSKEIVPLLDDMYINGLNKNSNDIAFNKKLEAYILAHSLMGAKTEAPPPKRMKI